MNVSEARRTRHLVIRLDRGDELPGALRKALDAAEARAAWIEGFGAVEAAELVVYDQLGRAYDKPRRLDGPAEVVSLGGNVALFDGAAQIRLSATLARENDVGLETFGGQLVWARAFELELHVTVFDDLTLVRVADERTGLPVIAGRPASAGASASAAAAPEPARQSSPGVAPVAMMTLEPGPALPARPVKPKAEEEIYPEVGDLATHFHFGECEVITSDGDRIRLRQDEEHGGRIREVSLAMLRVTGPQIGADGKRKFQLARKN